MTAVDRRPRVGILDHAASGMGGGQLVVAHLAATLAARCDTELLHYRAEPLVPLLERHFGLDLSRVGERPIRSGAQGFAIPGAHPLLRQLRENPRRLTAPYELFVYSGHGVPPFCRAARGLVYCHFPIEASPMSALPQDASWNARGPLDRWLRLAAYRRLWRRRMRRYTVVANSAYTAAWIRRRWHVRPHVVCPPVTLQPPARPKQNIVLSVGRFAGGLRGKHQLAQAQAFRALAAAAPGWRLVLIGSCAADSEDQAYLRAVKDAAGDAPVDVLANVDRGVVVEQLAAARLFWHTAGLGIDEEARPELAEHFGIATVEAMRAGCVPLVIASGGQREIIEDGVSGFLLASLPDLVTRTRQLMQDPARCRAMAARAWARSQVFTADAFERRILALAGLPREAEAEAQPAAACSARVEQGAA